MRLPEFDLRLVPSFVVLAEELHFGRAAVRLSVAQPALSRQILRLEQQLGSTLLIRSSREVQLTAAGEELLVVGREILARAVRAEAAVHDEVRQISVHVGDGLNRRLFHAVTSYSAAHPNVRVSIFDGGPSAAIESVLDGSTDVASAMLESVPAGLRFLSIDRQPFGVFCPPGHRLAGLEQVSWLDLDGEPVFIPEPGPADRYTKMLRGLLREMGSRPVEFQTRMVKPSYLNEHILDHQALLIYPNWIAIEWPEPVPWRVLGPERWFDIGLAWNAESASEETLSFISWVTDAVAEGAERAGVPLGGEVPHAGQVPPDAPSAARTIS